jgi:hypothetical protein
VGVVNYQYDVANRLTSVNGQAYTWDNNGNPSTSSGQACSRTACAATAMTTPTGSPNHPSRERHLDNRIHVPFDRLRTGNGAGDRVARTVDGVTTDYVLDPAAGLTQVLVESTGGQQTAYLYGHDLLAQYDSGTL